MARVACWMLSKRWRWMRKREAETVQALKFQGMRALISALGHWLAIRSRVWVSLPPQAARRLACAEVLRT